MDGVTILNTIELTDASFGTVVTLVITGVVFFILLFCMWLTSGSKVDNLLFFLFVVDAIVILVNTAIAAYQSENYKTGEIQYEVTIDDSVSMTEFNKKYEIVEQRGDIFVVKERK